MLTRDGLSWQEIRDLIKNDLELKSKELATLIFRPGLYISDYFYRLRNEIDFLTESYLIAKSCQINRTIETMGGEDEDKEYEKRSSRIANDDMLMNRLKQVREHLIEELTFIENDCYKLLESLSIQSIKSCQTLSLFDSIDSLLALIDSRVKKDQTFAKQCMQVYDSLVESITSELERIKSLILNNQTVIFWSTDDTMINLDPFQMDTESFAYGILVIFEDVYFNGAEVKYIK